MAIDSSNVPHPVSPDGEPEFDLDAMQAIIELDPDGEAGLVAELVQTFVQDAGEKIAQLHQKLSSGDAAGIHALTHQLKSSSATLGLMRLSRISRTIDDDARHGSLELASRMIGELESAFAAGREWLEARVPGR